VVEARRELDDEFETDLTKFRVQVEVKGPFLTDRYVANSARIGRMLTIDRNTSNFLRGVKSMHESKRERENRSSLPPSSSKPRLDSLDDCSAQSR